MATVQASPAITTNSPSGRSKPRFFGPIKRFRGNGTACWQEVYGTKDDNSAAKNWSRMVSESKAKEYLQQRQSELSQTAAERIAQITGGRRLYLKTKSSLASQE